MTQRAGVRVHVKAALHSMTTLPADTAGTGTKNILPVHVLKTFCRRTKLLKQPTVHVASGSARLGSTSGTVQYILESNSLLILFLLHFRLHRIQKLIAVFTTTTA